MTVTPAAVEAPASFGWCLDGHHNQCPGHLPEQTYPDPAGGTYVRPARNCGCTHHRQEENR